ncbi:hypothetical protein IKG73_01215 [Candidatus Saccharibacteria bacterium]|nr:hypothetical protein [Candidatus Saccharibacteria bacterium]
MYNVTMETEGHNIEFISAQFVAKFDSEDKIRRRLNEIEDKFSEHYGAPQTIPLPDDFTPDAPRIILTSKNNHSQIVFSQMSVGLNVNFDNEYINNYGKTKEYINDRIATIEELLKSISIDTFMFCGLSYNFRIKHGENTPKDFVAGYIKYNAVHEKEELFDASWQRSMVYDHEFFVNERMDVQRSYEGQNTQLPDLLKLSNKNMDGDGVVVSIDINNRFSYMADGEKRKTEDLKSAATFIYSLMEQKIQKWSGNSND